MTRAIRDFTVLGMIVLLVGACQPVRPVAEQPRTGLRADAPAYAIRGPAAAGVRDFTVGAGEDALAVTVWYPALNPHGGKEAIAYRVNAQLPAVQQVWYPPALEQPVELTVRGRALQDAPPDTAHGPYPLVIFAGGWANFRQTYSYLKEHLATHGFVVMSWDIRGEDFTAFWAGAALRPLDAQRTIDLADQLTRPGGALAGLIDLERLAVVGHSAGGTSALWGGGAQMSLGWCAAHPEEIVEFTNCAQYPPHQAEIAALLGLAAPPAGLWPATYDPRVDAIVAMAPDGDIWGADFEGVAAVSVPTLVMAASHDSLIKPAGSAERIYERLGAPAKSLVVFENADHLLFFTNCRDAPWLTEYADWVCTEPVWDRDRGHDLINHFVTAFLLSELAGDAAAATALALEQAAVVGVRYATTAAP